MGQAKTASNRATSQWLGRERKKETLDAFFQEELSARQRRRKAFRYLSDKSRTAWRGASKSRSNTQTSKSSAVSPLSLLPMALSLRRRFTCLELCLVVTAAFAQGGPPMRTDDPGIPGNRNWEINIACTQTFSS